MGAGRGFERGRVGRGGFEIGRVGGAGGFELGRLGGAGGYELGRVVGGWLFG